jgi:hypothetical protein
MMPIVQTIAILGDEPDDEENDTENDQGGLLATVSRRPGTGGGRERIFGRSVNQTALVASLPARPGLLARP